ncbi:uncharacterized protein LOC134473842 isoform X2 [Cavia porcellus]|uniref:uncharacterized protein LOC134473842 isoform X2 n=1 Tax=Cavia porcellus TaxID=10141 RepID=UPI002FDF8C6D
MIQARDLHLPTAFSSPPAPDPGFPGGPGGREGREREGGVAEAAARLGTATEPPGWGAAAETTVVAGAPASVRLAETEQDLARQREARALGGESAGGAGNVRQRTRARARGGRAHLLARGAPTRPCARTRPRLPLRRSPGDLARGRLSTQRAGRGRRWPRSAWQAWLALCRAEGVSAFSLSSGCQAEPELVRRRLPREARATRSAL